MSKKFNIIYLIASTVLLIYLALPNPKFPEKSQYSKRSFEPADVEDDDRRGYYNKESREAVINYYRKNFDSIKMADFFFKLPSLRLNYPPEESQTIIRDQNRSTYLEEIVHPFRESLFISGFEPKSDKDAIIVEDEQFNQKLVVKRVGSALYTRMLLGVLATGLLYITLFMWKKTILAYKF